MKSVTLNRVCNNFTGVRIIKKYGNRKLYDTTQAKYVTLSELRELIKSEKIKVIEHNSEKDVTYQTLISALADRELTNPKYTLNQLLSMLK